jgi:sodium transport system permease protein
VIRLVLLKELVDHLRDLRSVTGSLVLAVMGPLLLFGLFQIVQNLEKERPLDVPVVGAEQAPHLIQHLVANGVHVLPPPSDPEALVRKGDADMVLVIDDRYAEHYKASQLARVRLIVDDSRNESHKNVRRVERILLGYTQGLGALRLMARGVSPQAAAPLALEELDLATPQKLAANLLSMVPLFLMLAALIGGMNLAIDSTAGERERGSLEPLLLNPVSRRSLVLGKWLATALASTIVALLTLVGLTLTIQHLPLEQLGMKVALGPKEAGLILAALLQGSADLSGTVEPGADGPGHVPDDGVDAERLVDVPAAHRGAGHGGGERAARGRDPRLAAARDRPQLAPLFGPVRGRHRTPAGPRTHHLRALKMSPAARLSPPGSAGCRARCSRPGVRPAGAACGRR